MRKLLLACACSLSTVAALAVAGPAAFAAPSSCAPIPAPPAGENEIQPDPCATATAQASPNVTAKAVTAATPISSTPSSFSTTDGDILAITKVSGAATNQIAIGGNFTAVITPDGVSHAARNFAILDEATGTVLYAGTATNSNNTGYVRSLTSYAGTVYAGGDFTAFGGASRTFLAAINSSHAVTAFNAPIQNRGTLAGSKVSALTVDSTGVYFSTNSSVSKVTFDAATVLWKQTTTGGPTRSMKLTGTGYVFVGGLLQTYDGLARPGLVKVRTSVGTPDSTFNAHFKADTSSSSFTGEAALSQTLSPNGANLVVGIGGEGSNLFRKVATSTGALGWNRNVYGDSQAVITVGSTYVAGYHNNGTNPANHYAIQVNDQGSSSATTPWDPLISGTADNDNADGGNTGVQAAYADSSTGVLFLAGAFTKWNGVASHQSLIAFRFGAAASQAGPGAYSAITPTRLLDTRIKVGGTKFGPQAKRVIKVLGVGPVPPAGVAAVAITVTAVNPTKGGYLSVFNGATVPPTSNLNYLPGKPVANLVVVPVAGDGTITIFNGSLSSTDVLGDVSGYYGSGSTSAPGAYVAQTAARKLDTRNGTGVAKGKVAAGHTISFFTGVTGSTASSVLMNLTAVSSTKPGYVTAWATGSARPGTSNANFFPGAVVANLVLAPVNSAGFVSLYNGSAGTVDLVADVSGYFQAGTPTTSGMLRSITPVRMLDTRNGTGATRAKVKTGQTVRLKVAGVKGIATGTKTVALTVTAVSPTGSGYIAVWADGTTKPGVSNLNFTPGRIVANLVLAPVGSNGYVDFYNGSGGTVDLVADAGGYTLP